MINKKLLPIKLHFFFFMAALGPTLPQLQVFGKQMGISATIMGSITGSLPLAFMVAKPLICLLVDIYQNYRKRIFLSLICLMGLSYGALILIASRSLVHYRGNISNLTSCNDERDFDKVLICNSSCFSSVKRTLARRNSTDFCISSDDFSEINGSSLGSCLIQCIEETEIEIGLLLKSLSFWCFLIFMAAGTILFNVINSISDAICFDVVGENYDYGKQRVWGTIGYGITALLSGYITTIISNEDVNYKAAIGMTIGLTTLDALTCLKLKIPVLSSPTNIWKDLKELLKQKKVAVFLFFSFVVGTVDGFITYFLLWYVEDMSGDSIHIKLIEGIMIASQCFGGEILLFYVGDSILRKFGHGNCFNFCFMFYAIRLALISMVSNPWWIILIDFVLQGPTYAMTYIVIVAYANDIAPEGATATMQGIAAGLDDGLGYAVGSFVGGILYDLYGGQVTFRIFSLVAFAAGIIHGIIYRFSHKFDDERCSRRSIQYSKTPT